jgi:hypothetical protein
MEPECSLPCSQNPPLVSVLSQINPVHTTPSYLSKIHFNIIHKPSFPSGFFPSGLPTEILYAFTFTIHATFPAHLILLDLVTLIILGEDYKKQ